MGNLVSSCGSSESSPSPSNIKTNIPKSNSTSSEEVPKVNITKANNTKKNTMNKNKTTPLKADKEGNVKVNNATPSKISFKNTVNVKEIPSRNNLPKNNSIPKNIQGMKLKAETVKPIASAMKPNTRTNQEKAAGINPDENVTINSMAKAAIEGARRGKKMGTENVNLLFSPDEQNAENEKLLKEMTNPPVFELGTKPNPERPAGLAGGRRTRKQRKHRKH